MFEREGKSLRKLHLSFGEGAFAVVCSEQYHLLREQAMDHPEVAAILAACD